MLAPITRTITVPCPADRAFAIFADMAAWWPLEKRSMSLYATKSPAKSLAVDARLGGDRKSTRLNSSHLRLSRMPSSA